MDLFCKWWQDGVFSVTGQCFDIGNTVQDALQYYQNTGTVNAGSTHPMSAGNGSLMRLAPVPIFAYNNFDEAIELCAQSSLTTHGAQEAVDACRYYGGLIWGALHGETKETLLTGLYSPDGKYWESHPLCSSIHELITKAEYKTKAASAIRASGYVMHSLEAALWAFYNSNTFEEGALKAVNLGEDADTTGAIYGQLAGAYYGERALNFKWIRKLAHAPIFYLKAQELKEIIMSNRG
jgi:ADP-ribosylglycohydrolase